MTSEKPVDIEARVRLFARDLAREFYDDHAPNRRAWAQDRIERETLKLLEELGEGK